MLIEHCFLVGKITVQTKQWLDTCYGESSSSRQVVEKWMGEFKRGRTSTNDAERSGRPKDFTIPEIIEKIHDILLDGPKVKVRDLAEARGISIGSVVKILHEDVGKKQLTAKWVLPLLTIDQKRRRVRDSKSCLDLFNRIQSDFSRRLVAIDETRIHHYTAESKQQAKPLFRSVELGGTAPTRAKTQQTAGKVMASVFWDSSGILFINYLEKENQSTVTITVHYWTDRKKKAQENGLIC